MNYNTTLSKRSFILDYLIIAITSSVFFVNLIKLPYVGFKLQFTEILFLLTVPFIPFKQVIDYHLKQHKTLLLLIMLYALFDLISSLASKEILSVTESAARIYLFSLFFYLLIISTGLQSSNCLIFLPRFSLQLPLLFFDVCSGIYTIGFRADKPFFIL